MFMSHLPCRLCFPACWGSLTASCFQSPNMPPTLQRLAPRCDFGGRETRRKARKSLSPGTAGPRRRRPGHGRQWRDLVGPPGAAGGRPEGDGPRCSDAPSVFHGNKPGLVPLKALSPRLAVPPVFVAQGRRLRSRAPSHSPAPWWRFGTLSCAEHVDRKPRENKRRVFRERFWEKHAQPAQPTACPPTQGVGTQGRPPHQARGAACRPSWLLPSSRASPRMGVTRL